MSAFLTLFDAFLDEYHALQPVHATHIGDHRFDHRWPDLSDAGRLARLAFAERWMATLSELDPGALRPNESIDRDLVVQELQAQHFADTELREEAWDPLGWVYLIGEGLFPLLAREFAPLADRLTSVAGRLEGLPGLVDGARTALVGLGPERPVARLHTETAIHQLPGVAELIDDALLQGTAAAPSDARVAALQPRLETAAAEARRALAGLEAHLRDVVLPGSVGDGRIGAELFAAKMRHTMRSDELTPERILAAAEAEYAAVRSQMVRLAGQLWGTWRGDAPRPSDDGALVRGVLDAVALQHPEASDLLEYCRLELVRIEAFCTERALIGLADEPLDIRWTPEFMRSYAGAMLIAPGPLDHGLPTFFAITPIPDDWSAERRESYLREDNDRMLRLLTIHEAVPGHYLQAAYANRTPSLPRAVFASGLFAEGWAVYVTQVLMDAGYGAEDPALLLVHWKFYLRSITNAIIDARIHTADMTEAEAVALMVEGGFQEEAEARAKYDRARLTSTQLSTYFAGSLEMWDIELEARRRAAATAGADPDAIVPGPLPGGFGETAGFEYRPHLEAVISAGEPPTSLLRRILFG